MFRQWRKAQVQPGIDRSSDLANIFTDIGISGRVAVYELMKMNNELRSALSRGEDAATLRYIAVNSGMKTLRYDALTKVHQGITSAQEAIAVMFAPELM